MKIHHLIPLLVLPACATTGGGGKGSSGSWQGDAAVTKRRLEISDAAKLAMECMKVKPGDEPGKGGIFSVVADANGKLAVDAIKWDGPAPMKQCIVEAAVKSAITPLPGPSVGTLWEFLPPGSKSEPQTPPEELKVAMQPLAATMQAEAIACGTRFLGVDFGAQIDVAYFLYKDGKAYAPTVIKSDAKDGAFESCVQDIVLHTKFPALNVEKPFGTTIHFKIGIYGDTQHRKD
jgi:hypothetical protein